MIVISWNIQWCRGVDGRVDPARIVSEARRIADFDVLCVQEVADNFPDPRLASSGEENQFESLAALLPEYSALPGIAVDRAAQDGRRRRFGNMILSRLPVQQAFRYLLPFPLDHGVKGMPRIAIEAVINAPHGGVRVITTHLEYYSRLQKLQQVDALRDRYAEGYQYATLGTQTDASGGPFQSVPRPAATLICGDFNFEPNDPLHVRMQESFADETPSLIDAWQALYPREPHPSTFRIHEKTYPGEPELHCDFVFVNAPLRERMTSLHVDRDTQAADHQPVIATFE